MLPGERSDKLRKRVGNSTTGIWNSSKMSVRSLQGEKRSPYTDPRKM